MTKRWAFLSLLLGALCVTPRAAEAFQLGVYGVLSKAGTSASPPAIPVPPEYSGEWNGGFGAYLRDSSSLFLNMEIGAQVLKRTYTPNNTGDFSQTMLDIPVMLRFTAAPILTIGVGGYTSFRMGDLTSTSGPVLTPNLRGFDYGLVGAVGLEMPFGPIGLFTEVRYYFGVTDMDRGASNFYTRQFNVLGGLKVGW